MNLMAGRQLLLSSLWKASTKETGSEDVVDVEAAGQETPVAVETGDAQIEWKPAAKRFCPTDSLAECLPAPVVSPAVVDDTPVSTTCTSFDVNSLLGKYLTDNDRAEWIDKCFCPPDGYIFPERSGRKCKSSWLETYKWLRFSPALNGCFCLACVLFGKSNANRGQLVSSPLTNFHKAASALERHSTQQSHLLAVADMSHFQSVQSTKQGASSVQAQLLSVNAQRRDSNCAKLRVIIKSVLFLGRQNIPFRGHREPSTKGLDLTSMTMDHNPGNFMALLHLLASSGCQALAQQFQAVHGSSYISPNIQNQLIECIGHIIRGDIVDRVRKAKFFTVICDEATDISNQEQMALVVRYVDTSNEIREDFLDFLLCKSTSGANIAGLILKRLEELSLDAAYLRGQ